MSNEEILLLGEFLLCSVWIDVGRWGVLKSLNSLNSWLTLSCKQFSISSSVKLVVESYIV